MLIISRSITIEANEDKSMVAEKLRNSKEGVGKSVVARLRDAFVGMGEKVGIERRKLLKQENGLLYFADDAGGAIEQSQLGIDHIFVQFHDYQHDLYYSVGAGVEPICIHTDSFDFDNNTVLVSQNLSEDKRAGVHSFAAKLHVDQHGLIFVKNIPYCVLERLDFYDDYSTRVAIDFANISLGVTIDGLKNLLPVEEST